MSTDNIKVCIKIRPLIQREKNENLQSEWNVENEKQITAIRKGHSFVFDHIFCQDKSIEELFRIVVKPIVTNALNGINGTIFAYGQTSSGKTYCMNGTETELGIVPLTVREIFNQIDLLEDRELLIRVGYIEIYNEKIYDLLDEQRAEVTKIHEPNPGEVNIAQLEVMVSSQDMVIEHYDKGNKTKRMGETAMNDRSSRSHAIFSITIESREKSSTDGECRVSTLNLVDLAGSERADMTKAKGERLNESKHINQSLLALGKVIRELTDGGNGDNNGGFISYRDSKLTRLLSASLGGNAKTAIICTVTPASIDETYSTLTFASNAKKIKNKPIVNKIVSEKIIMNRLHKEIANLKNQLEEEKSRNTELVKIKALQQRIIERENQIIHCHNSDLVKPKDIHRRRTWMCSSSMDLDDKVDTKFISPDSYDRILMPPPPPFLSVSSLQPIPEIMTSPNDLGDFQSGEEIDFDKDNFETFGKTNEDLVRRLHTPRAFKRIITVPDSPTITLPSEITAETRIKELENRNKYLEEELEELQEFKLIENLCNEKCDEDLQVANSRLKYTEMELEKRENDIKVLHNELMKKKTEIEDLRSLEENIKIAENETKKALKQRKEFENILESIRFEHEVTISKAKKREEELIESLNEARCDTTLQEKIKSLEDILLKTERDLLAVQLEKSTLIDDNGRSTELEKKLNDLQHQLQIETSSRIETEQLLKEKLKELDQTSVQLMDAVQETESLQSNLKILEQDIVAKEKEIEEVKMKFTEHEETILKAKKREEELIESLNEARDDTTLQEKIKSLEANLLAVQLEKSTFIDDNGRFTKLEGKLNDLQHQLQIETSSRIETENLLKEKSKEFEQTSDQLMDAVQETESLQSNLKNLEQDIVAKEKEIEELQMKFTEHEETILKAKKREEELIESLNEARDDTTLQEKIKSLEANLLAVQLEKSTFIDDNGRSTELEKKLNDLQHQLQIETSSRIKNEQLLKEKSKELYQTSVQLMNAVQETESLQSNLKNLEQDIVAKEKEIEELQMKFTEHEETILKAKKREEELIESLNEARDDTTLQKKIKSLEANLLAVQLEKSTFIDDNGRSTELEKKLNDLQHQLQIETSSRIENEQLLKEKSKELDQTSVQLMDAVQETESLQSNLKNLEQDILAKEKEIEELQMKFTEHEETILKAKKREEELIESLNEARDDTTLQEKIKSLEANLLAVQLEKSTFIDDNGRSIELEKKLNDLQHQLQIETSSRNENEQLLKEKLKELDQTSVQLMDAVQETESLQNNLRILEQDILAKEKKIEELQVKFIGNEVVVRRFNKIREILNNQNNTSQDYNDDDDEDETGKIIIKLIHNASKTETLEVEKLQLLKEIDSIRSTAVELSENIQTLTDELARKSAELDDLKVQYRRRSQDNERKLQEIELANIKLNQDIGAIEAAKMSLENELKRLRNEILNLKTQNKSLNEKNASIIEKNCLLEDELVGVKAIADNHSGSCKLENDQLKKEVKLLSESVAQHTKENYIKDEKIQVLEVKCESLTREIEYSKYQPKKSSSPVLQNRRSGEEFEDEAFALKNKHLQAELNHGTPIRAMKSNIERKTRRQSVYDERRRLSAWELTQTVETQTEQVNELCACNDLVNKLKDLQIELRKSEMKIANNERMARCNPLKIDLGETKKKLEREQSENFKMKSSIENLHGEIKMLQSQNGELKLKLSHLNDTSVSKIDFEKLLNEKNMIEKKLLELARCQLQFASEKENVGVNTSFKYSDHSVQNGTNDELTSLKNNYGILDDNFNNLKKKYDMAKRLCNLRQDDLKKARDEISAKTDEVERITAKYNEAKRICIIRMEKINLLRAKLGIIIESEEETQQQ